MRSKPAVDVLWPRFSRESDGARLNAALVTRIGALTASAPLLLEFRDQVRKLETRMGRRSIVRVADTVWRSSTSACVFNSLRPRPDWPKVLVFPNESAVSLTVARGLWVMTPSSALRSDGATGRGG